MGGDTRLANRRKQLRYRANHRGIKEMDIIFGRFADQFISDFGDDELDRFEALMAYNDRDLLQWFTGEVTLPDSVDTKMFESVSTFASKKLSQETAK